MNALKLKREVGALKELPQARTAIHARTAERMRAIYLRAQGASPFEIAGILGRNVDTVRRWIKLFNDSGPAALQYRRTGGRSGSLTAEQEEALARWVEEGTQSGRRLTLKVLADRLAQTFGVSLSQQQISERLRSNEQRGKARLAGTSRLAGKR